MTIHQWSHMSCMWIIGFFFFFVKFLSWGSVRVRIRISVIIIKFVKSLLLQKIWHPHIYTSIPHLPITAHHYRLLLYPKDNGVLSHTMKDCRLLLELDRYIGSTHNQVRLWDNQNHRNNRQSMTIGDQSMLMFQDEDNHWTSLSRAWAECGN